MITSDTFIKMYILLTVLTLTDNYKFLSKYVAQCLVFGICVENLNNVKLNICKTTIFSLNVRRQWWSSCFRSSPSALEVRAVITF